MIKSSWKLRLFKIYCTLYFVAYVIYESNLAYLFNNKFSASKFVPVHLFNGPFCHFFCCKFKNSTSSWFVILVIEKLYVCYISNLLPKITSVFKVFMICDTLSFRLKLRFCCWILDPKSYRNMSFISCHFISKGILETNILLSGGARLLLPFVPDVPGPPLRPLPRSCLSPPRPPLLSSLRSTGELKDGENNKLIFM